MNFFEGKCPQCGKKVFLTVPSDIRFCSKVCETNYKFEKNRMLRMS